jgi:hypothetical protein
MIFLGSGSRAFGPWPERRHKPEAPQMTSKRFRQGVDEYQDQAWMEQVMDKLDAGLSGDAD